MKINCINCGKEFEIYPSGYREKGDCCSISKKFPSEIGKIKKGKLIRTHSLDAGQDIISNENKIIKSNSSEIIKTNLYINVPENYVGLIWSRSGLSVKHKIEVGAGCIDSGYTGEILVHLYNFGKTDYNIKNGDKIAQLLTVPVNLNNYQHIDKLDVTDRNDGGFGHTGK